MISQFNAIDFLPLQTLINLKIAQKRRISLIIPALNEEKTIHTVVSTARIELIERFPLLDELIVMDGGSTDDTIDVARQAGAQVNPTDQVLPHLNIPTGKGSSLWKSLFVSTGDILIFIDADILHFDPHFIYGLAGALLHNEHLQCVKAFYRRPLVCDGNILEDNGGRVTELMARPLLSTWYPELARIRQPLSGEYAFNRSALMQIPFSSGYGVDIRLLVEAYLRFGLQSIAQVDMGRREHRNRSLSDLGIMSQAILTEFMRILQENRKATFDCPPATTMISPASQGWAEVCSHDIVLPAAHTITV